MRLAGESATEVGGARDTYLLFITTSMTSGNESSKQSAAVEFVLPYSANWKMGIAQTAAHARTER
jgi:hypothetical protein